MMSAHDKVAILMVDDRPENLMALEAVLDSDDYLLVGANSGEEALKQVLQYDFAVILLDVQMPGLNGFETAEIIKQRHSSNHIPIIFVTALSKANEHVSTGYLTGAIDYIFKPFNPVVLRSKVEAFVQIYRNQKEIERRNKQLELQSQELQRKQNNLETIINEKTVELTSANEELKISHERFQKIFQFSPNLMAIRSLIDNRYVDVNKSWVTFTGYELHELADLNDDVLNLSPASKDKTSSNEIADLQADIYNQEITYVTRDQNRREGLLSTETATINGEPCLISTITDITEMVKLEKEVSRLDRLNLVGEMAAGIAHEIRNPMTTVLGFLQLAKNENHVAQPQEYINLMIDELNRANGIITEFLTLAKDKANNRRKKDLNSIVKTLHPLLRAEAMMKNKIVLLELTDCPELWLDEKEIRQLILNIGLNGLEAMDAGGTLILKTYSQNDETVILEITDNGPGIKQEVLEQLGTPFFTTKDQGTGLGLAICYSIASRHSAHIDIQTSEKGTSFLISFQLTNDKVVKVSN
ncbi:response regulator [Alkalihalobacillus sp. MEB130]|uniref:response regulator n=1 Tax=Alkalihalobacillus sp. MEB130 TaxID=2976704 RepID=UPI0028DE7B81|nr:response regulator [Alkalihalobacillus sp. MEB130]MDT8859216.1 response regulator [Alkalihalobacillus sp. MEB130]